MTRVHAEPRSVAALKDVAGIDAGVVLLGLETVDDGAWEILAASGLRLVRATDESAAVRAVAAGEAQVVLADIARARPLIRSVRAEGDLAAAHVVVCAEADQLRAALDAGADDVMRIPFEPEVLAARVTAGLRAARLRANEALLRSLVANIPGAVYRCACDEDWTMEWLSDEIEAISGYTGVGLHREPGPHVHERDPSRRPRAGRAIGHGRRRRRPAVHDRVPDRPLRR